MRCTLTIWSLTFALLLRAAAGTMLCIGLNDYDDYLDLKYAESDAIELGRVFAGLGHKVEVLIGKQVTRANVQRALALQPEFVYFAGHALSGRLLVRDGEIALADVANADRLTVLDCCYVGQGLKTTGTMKILAASQYEAFEDGTHGLFTKHLLIGLGEGQSLSSEVVLTAYLKKSINAETGGWQTPVLGFLHSATVTPPMAGLGLPLLIRLDTEPSAGPVLAPEADKKL